VCLHINNLNYSYVVKEFAKIIKDLSAFLKGCFMLFSHFCPELSNQCLELLPYAQPTGEKHVWKYIKTIDYVINVIKINRSNAEGLEYVTTLLGRIYDVEEED